ncbi:MAG: penicillin-binding protein 2 [Nitrospinae bacterium]|nr:penicillin-binding protein 2 [Nitrospinota bacterium]
MRNNKKTPLSDHRSGLRKRLVLASACLLVFGGALLARLFFLQVLQHDNLYSQSEKQYLGSTKVYYGRGDILDRNLNPLATNIEVESVYINPNEIEDKRGTARLLASSLDLDPGKTLRKLSSSRQFIWIKRKCDLKETEKLKRLGLPGVSFVSEQKRFYPKRELAAHILGFVGLDNQGLSGAEHYHHDILKGASSLILMQKDARGRQIHLEDGADWRKARSYDVVLTIDEVVQFIAEFHLKSQVRKYDAKGGMAVVMDPFTGEIYAMVNAPLYNPNNYSAYPSQRWKNPIVSGMFEPGSVFKPVLASAAIDAGAAAPSDIFFCENGSFKVGKVSIGEAANHKFGWMTLTDIISKSSNIGVIKVGQKLGERPFYDYMKKFGFGGKLNVDLPGEAKGKLRDLSQWSNISLASVSFGQEISVTPIQMAAAYSAIANGGNLVRPRVTKAIVRDGKTVKTFKPEQINRVMSETTSRLMVDILKNTVKNGTGRNAAVPGFDAAGKTGTAQKLDPNTLTYSKTGYLSSFIGFVPADSPKLAILVMIDEPQGIHYGGEVAAPVFREIARETLRYLNVPSGEERVLILDRV